MDEQEARAIGRATGEAVGSLLESWIKAYNECVQLDTVGGYSAALALATCCVNLADAFGVGHARQIEQLRKAVREAGR